MNQNEYETMKPQVGLETVGTMFETVMAAVLMERKFQDAKHGTIDVVPHTLGEWILLIEAELDECKAALIKGGDGRDSVRSELVQIAALAVACLEQHGLIDPHTGRQV